MRYTFVVTLLICKGTFSFSKRAYILTSFLYHNRGGGKNDVKFDVKSLVV